MEEDALDAAVAAPPKAPRVYITVKRKVEVCEKVLKARKDNTDTLKGIAREEELDPSQIRRWLKNYNDLKKMTWRQQSNWTLHGGRKSSFPKPNDLVSWVLDLRREGMPVSMGMVILKASQLDGEFRRKKRMAKYSVVRRILRSNRIVIRAKTHQAQRAPQEMHDEAKFYITGMRPSVSMANRDQKWIINMDQTPVYFSMVPNTTLEEEGARSVNVRSSSGSTMRVTVAVTVTAAGGTLTPLMVFKGKPNGRIARDFTDKKAGFPDGCFYACQDTAWMDETVMLMWVDKVLKPWVKDCPPGIVPLLLLDHYKCHLMASVVNAIQDLGIEVDHIPGGCTGLVQPVDVGVNKPYKNRIRNKWEKYMLDEGLLQTKTKPPT